MRVARSLRRWTGADVPRRRASDRYDDGTAGRLLSALHLASGVVTLASPLLPRPPGFDTTGVVLVGGITTLAGLAGLQVPWGRLPRCATLAGVPPALALIVCLNLAGGVDPYRFGLFFLVVFVWVGMSHRRGTGTALGPLALAAYLAPLLLRHAPTSTLASAAYTVPMYVAISETLAWRSARLRETQRRLAGLAYQDQITGLANRTSFQARLDRALAELSGDASCWVLFVDLDGFKAVNDTLGHAGGDELLRRVAAALRQACPPPIRLCRWAGDEFAALLVDVDEAAVERIVQRVRGAVAAIPRGTGSPVTASIGVARAGAGTTSDEVVNRADQAMYRDKATHLDRHRRRSPRAAPAGACTATHRIGIATACARWRPS